jgi:phosphate transport system substrate-binding protein
MSQSGERVAIPSSPAPAAVSLSETGSTLLYPLFGAWASAYHRQSASVSSATAATRSDAAVPDGTAARAVADATKDARNWFAFAGAEYR